MAATDIDVGDDIYDKLKAEGFAGTMYIGADPGATDTPYFILRDSYDSGNPKWLRDTVSLQVQGIGDPDKYPQTKKKMLEIREILNGIPEWSTADADYIRVVVLNGPFYVGPDQNSRHNFSMNFEITLEPKTGTNREPLT